MLRLLALLLLFTAGILAEEDGISIEVTAKTIQSTKNTVSGSNGVVVYYGDSVIKADRATYNRETKLLVLDGKVEMMGYQGSKEHTSHLEIHTERNEVTFDELFLASKNDVWLYTEKAHRVDGNYTFGRSVLSSCDADDPLWKMAFESSKYDSQEEYMKVYDAKIYFKDVPVMYTPYMAFSTNNQRESGLLFPLFGVTSNEGFIYEQPIFWAISDSMDLEFNPQIRTRRSLGMYATYRFVDSAHSSGTIRAGYFKDKASYVEDHALPEDSHYGLELNYESSKLFSGYFPEGTTDGLYINSTFLNDIDYINLQQTTLTHFGLTPLQESRLNYFLYDDDYYAGVNAKYYVDTRKVNNDDTMQQLPSISLHKYLHSFLIDNITYSTDLRFNNFTRKEGPTMQQVELKIPILYTASFLDNFLNISLGEDLFYNKSSFGNEVYMHDAFQYYSNLNKAEIFSDLTKKYKNFTHVVQPSLAYRQPGHESEKPVTFDNLTEDQQRLFAVGLPEQGYIFSLGQYFYDENMNLKFYQRFLQNYFTDREYKLADMTNEMQYNWKKWGFYNLVTYSNEFKEIRDSASRITLSESEYHLGLSYTFKQNLGDQSIVVPANDVNFNFGYTYNQNIGVNGSLTYNIDDALSKQWSFGGSYKVDCWSMAASMRRAITPRPTGETVDDTFYIQLNFIPFATVGTK
jgi:LPS-assembly protein